MLTDTGWGSPIATDDTGSGWGSPVVVDGLDAGWGAPVIDFGGDSLPMTLRMAFQSDASFETHGFDPAYSEDGGTLVEVWAAWRTPGPMRAQLRSAGGILYPGAAKGCYGADFRDDALYVDESGLILRFAMPRVPRGTYDIVVTWGGGSATNTKALRAVPRMVPAATYGLLRAPVLGTFLGRR